MRIVRSYPNNPAQSFLMIQKHSLQYELTREQYYLNQSYPIER